MNFLLEKLMHLTMAGMAVAILTVVSSAAAQRETTGKPADTSTPAMKGCVSAKPDAAGNYTFTETGSGNRFRITGKSFRDYSGKQVEILLGDGKGLTIKGGLTPSANVAGQAGHIDPVQAAIASQPGANVGKSDAPLPEIRVNGVRAVEGPCRK